VGCGICTTHCKFDAIQLEKVYDAGNGKYFGTLGKIVTHVPSIGAGMVKKQLGRRGGGNA